MRTKNGSVRELIAGIRQATEQEAYNPAEDLKTLQTQYKRLGKKDFGLMLDAMVEKYATGEYAVIHAALVEKARNGDIEAIKMYREMQSSGGTVRAAYYTLPGTPNIPTAPSTLYSAINDMEQVLWSLHELWQRNSVKQYAGEICAGQEIGVI